LLKQGFTDFTIFEASDGVGGTWHVQDYPGLACDVWAHSYTFSWEPNPEWTASFVEQPEIEAYLQACATRFGLDPYIRLNTRITKARYSEPGRWTLESAAGESVEFDVVINAMGNQHTPLYPDVPGMDTFQGDSWHSVQWNHDVDLKGKRVAVVGSAASAVQIVPELAKEVEYLAVLQRSANWIMPRNRKFYSDSKRNWFRRLPVLMKITRYIQCMMMGQVYNAVTIGHSRVKQFENMVIKYMESVVSDPVMRKQLTPDTPYGCKRGLVSDDFYPALVRDNVELIADGLKEVTATGVVTASGRAVDVDVIVYCTGYRILDFDRIEVTGADGQQMAEVMARSADAYKGISVPGFPNYFFAVGPNGLVLNAPYFQSVEKSLETIVRLLGGLRDAGARQLDVKQQVHKDYIDWMSGNFEQFTWGASSCHSYYQSETGHPPFLFPGDIKKFRRLHDECGLHDYNVV
jgi:cation diffusion facilitator CzcD-associated flavoprotein CzcO